MLVGKRWKIESDELNITISKRHTVKAKPSKPAHDVWKVFGYYATIKNALIGLVDSKIRESELKDLKSIVQKQEEIYNLIKGLTNLPKGATLR